MKRRHSERGAALLTVLAIVAMMAVLSVAALDKLKLATRLSVNTGGIEQARAYAFAAETVARYRIGDLLQRDQARTTLIGNWEGQPTNFPVDNGVAAATLTDGGNCFNVNSLVTEAFGGQLVANPTTIVQFARLMVLLDVPGRDAAQIAASAADWIDSDAAPLSGGAEDAAYANDVGARVTANTTMADRSELRAIASMTPEIYARIAPLVCALPTSEATAINVNTLRPTQVALLAALSPGLTLRQAGAAIFQRPAAGYESLTAFWNLPSLAGVPADARGGVRLTTRWFGLRLDIALEGAQFEEHALIDAAQRPARLVRRSYGEAT